MGDEFFEVSDTQLNDNGIVAEIGKVHDKAVPIGSFGAELVGGFFNNRVFGESIGTRLVVGDKVKFVELFNHVAISEVFDLVVCGATVVIK